MSRLPIIDTTVSNFVAENPFGDEPEVAGFYLAQRSALHGVEILPDRPFDTFDEAQKALIDRAMTEGVQ